MCPPPVLTQVLSFFVNFLMVFLINLLISTSMRHSGHLLYERISKTIKNVTKRLRTCVDTSGAHKKHVFAALSSVFL